MAESCPPISTYVFNATSRWKRNSARRHEDAIYAMTWHEFREKSQQQCPCFNEERLTEPSSLGASKRGNPLDSWQRQQHLHNNKDTPANSRFKTVSQDWKHALILQPGVRRKFFRSLCGVVPSTRTAFVVSVVWWRGCLPLDKYGYCLQRESHGGAVPDNGRVHRQAPCFAIFAYICLMSNMSTIIHYPLV